MVLSLTALALIASSLFIGAPAAEAQTSITINGTDDAAGLAASLFGNECTSVTDAVLVGESSTLSQSQVGTFAAQGIGISSGVVLSTGAAQAISGTTANTVGNFGGAAQAQSDPDVDALATNGAFDTASLTFNITSPIATTISGRYVLGSEEWTEYVNSGFADALAIFVNGTNVALVPGTSAVVSIDSINQNTNSQYFVNNDIHDSAPASPLPIEPDGLTVPIDFTANLVAGLNEIKLGVVDDGDNAYDSWAFFEAESFTCPPPVVSIVKIADVSSVNAVGDPIQYSFTVSNDGPIPLTNVSVDDPMVGTVTCAATSLAGNASTTCTADNLYLATQPQIDAGEVANTATANATDANGTPVSSSDDHSVPATQTPLISVVKSADVGSVAAEDDPIDYSFVVTNDGNVTLTSVGVADAAVGAVSCLATTLAPGASTSCTADSTYLTTQLQVDAGEVANTATASGAPPTGPVVTGDDTLTIPATQTPLISVVKSADVGSVAAEDDPIDYSFVVTNDGNVTLTSVGVSDGLVGVVSCPVTTLAPGGSTTCTADSIYLTTQLQVDAGEVVNTATASGTPPTGPAVGNSDTLTIPATQTPLISIVKSADVTSVNAEDDPISYSFVVTNSGNVTLTGVGVSDAAVGVVSCPVTTLAPGGSTTCTADSIYLTTQLQVDAGEVVNTATASGTPPSGPVVTGDDTLTIPATQTPLISIVKSADVASVNAEDDPIDYSFVVTNSGNVTLASVGVNDAAVGVVSCPVTTLAPGGSTTCTADNTYLTTQPQVDTGEVVNTATASGTPPTGPVVTGDDTLTIPATQTPLISIVKSADVASVNAEDDPIDYSFVVTNSGNVTLASVGVNDAAVGVVSCPVTTLAPGASTTCTADNAYLTTQLQVDAGEVVNTATASGTPPSGPAVGNSDTLTIPATQIPLISIVKSADVTSVAAEDDPIDYSFVVTNDGNVTLTSVGVNDAAVGVVSCPVTTLAPGGSTTCTADSIYLTTQLQVDAGEVVNTATASGTPPSGPAVGNSDTLTIPATQTPLISITKSADVGSVAAEDDPIDYSFVVTNSGNVTLASVGVSDAAVGVVSCPVTTLAPGGSTTCTADSIYLTTQLQVDAGEVVNTATASGTPPSGPVVTGDDTLTIPATQTPLISIVKSADVASVNAEDDPINYSFVVTNDGNVTLTSVGVNDAAVGAVSCPVTTLAPGGSTTCTADSIYLTTQLQVDAGEVVNTATASGTPPTGPVVTGDDTLTIPATQTPLISIVKSADVTSVNAEDDPIDYSFVVTNDGNVTLTSVAVADVAIGAVSCPVSTLAPTESTTCTADSTYLTTQPQVDAGEVVNTATASGTPPTGPVVTSDDTLTIPATQTPLISITKSADVTSVAAEDDPINYSFLVTNTGNLTLASVGVTDAAVGVVSCPVTTLAPAESTTCTADTTYLTTQPQVDVGEVVNTASAAGTPPTGPAVTDDDTLIIPAIAAPLVSIAKTADVASVSNELDPIDYSFLVTNTGNLTLTSVGVTDAAVGAVTCPVTTLAPAESTTCTADATYLTTQSQVDAGEVVNTATASGTPPSGPAVENSDTLTIPAAATPLISISKTADVASVSSEDDPIEYSFLVTNVGNVTLTNVGVTDVAVGVVTCPVTTLAPTESTTCTADNSYLTTQVQVDAGEVLNTATAAGSPPAGAAVTADDSLQIPVPAGAAITLSKSADVASVDAENDPIQYSFLVTNVGNVTLTGVGITDAAAGSISCPVTTLAPTESTTCTAVNTYLTTQPQVDSSEVLNTATVSGTPPTGAAATATDTLTVPATQTPLVSVVKSADVTSVSNEDDPIEFSFLVTNSGNVTLTAVGITDVAAGSISCPVTTLAPAQSTTCTADNPYLTTQSQVDAGQVVNTATASGTPPLGPAAEATNTLTIPATAAAAISLVKSADVASVNSEDDPIEYSFVVTNNGNVTLTNVAVNDAAVGSVTCPSGALAPTESTTCTADNTYLTTQGQVDAGQVVNTASTTASTPAGPNVSTTAALTIPATSTPSISMVKSADVASVNAEDDPIEYSFVVTNTGNVTLTGVGVSDGAVGAVTCAVTTLAPTESTICNADNTYLTTQPQVDAGEVINTASATGTPPAGAPPTATDTLTIPVPVDGAISIVKSADVAAVNAENDPINYSFVVTNTGNVTLTSVGVTDAAVGLVTCPVATLAPTDSTTCTADNTYLTTQPQVDAGEVVNTASATGTPPSGAAPTATDTLTVPAAADAAISIVKSADAVSVNGEDDPINYSFVVTNTGNVTLTSVGVTDAAVGLVTCPVTTLAPTNSTTCTADNTYLTTQLQIDAGEVVNTATATGAPPTGAASTATDTLTIPAAAAPSISIVKSADVSTVDAEDDPIDYSFGVTNTGNVTLTGVAITDGLAGAVTCPATTLAPTESTTCTADTTYLTTQVQVDAGEVVNNASVAGTPPNGPAVGAIDSVTVPATAAPAVTIVKSADVSTVDAEDDPINYSFVVTNTGNVTLTTVGVNDAAVGAVSCPVTTLAPTESTMCIADDTYLTTQPQVDAGEVVNTATSTGTPPVGEPVEAADTLTIPVPSGPAISIIKSADVSTVDAEDDPINYSFVVTNSGNVTLTAVGVSDAAVGAVSCPANTLVPGESTTCTANNTYLTTQPQVDAGEVVNTATATGSPPSGAASTASDTLTIPASADPAISIVKSADVASVSNEDDPIDYSFVVTNTGNVTLTTVGVSDAAVGSVTCLVTTLAPSESTTCTADNTYLATQPQVDAGEVVNTATATGTPPSGAAPTATDTLTIPAEATPAIILVKAADVVSVSALDDPINYNFVVINNGNVTLSNVAISDGQVGAVTCLVTTLAPTESTTCTADNTYLTTQPQVDAGEVVNTASVGALPPTGPAVNETDSLTISVPADASIALVKSADVASVNAEGDPIEYSFVVTNTGNVTLTSVGVLDAAVGAVTCAVSSLAPTESTTCTADNSYLTTQPQVDAGEVLNTATATGTPPVGDPVEATDTLSLPAAAASAISIVKSADVASVNAEGDPIAYSFVVTNTGNVTLSAVAVSDAAVGAVTCAVTTLAPTESTTCTADNTYLTTQPQVDAGEVVNTATATGTPPTGVGPSASDTLTIPAAAAPAIAILKSADVTSVSNEDDPINYSFVVTNSGNVTLTSVAITDGLAGAVTCPDTTLAPTESTTCTADSTYLTTQPQIDAGEVVNNASVAGTPPSGPVVVASDTVTVTANPAPAINLVKSGDVVSVDAEDDPIEYSFVMTNTGNVTLTSVGVSDPAVGAVSCPVSSLAPGASTTCTADITYLTTQLQVDAGEVVNTASATGTPPIGDPVQTTDTLTIPVPSGPAISITKSADVTSVNNEGDPIIYSFVVANTGNVTLTGVGVADAAVGAVTCLITTLAPTESTTCTADNTYLTTQPQVDAGQVVNTATATGAPPAGAALSATDTLTIPAAAAASVSIVKSGDVVSVDAEDDPIEYSFVMTNTGNVTLTSVGVVDAAVGAVSCPVSSLAPGASTTCTADNTYLTTQLQVDAGEVVNTASATGTPPVGDPVEATDTLTIPVPSGPAISIVKSADVTSVNNEGDPINYSFVVANTGNVTLTGVVVSDGQVGVVTCPATTLAPAESTTCTADATYLTTQPQVDAGEVVNTATVTGTPPSGPAPTASDTLTIPADATPVVILVKAADVASVSNEDDPINYSFVVINNGNVTLSDVAISDGQVGAVTCPATMLAPAESTTCTADATYLTTQPQVDAGEVVNTASVAASPPSGPALNETDTLTIPAAAAASVSIVKSAGVTSVSNEGDPIGYSFVVTNTGNTTLTNVAVSDAQVGAVTCPATTLAPAESTTCTAGATYLTTQPQVDAGEVVNTATATGTPPVGDPVEATDTLTIPVPSGPAISIVKSADVASASNEDDPINYSFLVTNIGNTSLTNVAVSDVAAGPVTCAATTLAPQATTACTADATYLTTQDQVNDGQVINTATATGTPPAGDVVTSTDTLIVQVPAAPAISLVKSSSTTALTFDGQIVDFEFAVTNTGNVTLTSIDVEDLATEPVSCPQTTLQPGTSTTCTAAYTVSQDDVDAGFFLNTATVSGTPPVGDVVTATDTVMTPSEQLPSITIVKSADVTQVAQEDDPVSYSFVVTNNGNVTLTAVTVTDPLAGTVTCDATQLTPGASTDCTADATVLTTQAQIDAGEVVNTATAQGTPPAPADPVSASDTVSIPALAAPAVSLIKSGDVTQVDAEDDPIAYSFVVTNIGNTTLTSVAISDGQVGSVSCPATTLAPTESTTCTADVTYLTTQAQVDAGEVVNTATVTASPPTGVDVNDVDTLTLAAPSDPGVALVKSSPTTQLTVEGQVVPFEFLVTNTGNVTLTAVGVDDLQTGPVTCPLVTLAPNTSTTCTADYTVTQDDVDAGSFENTATASGTPPTGAAVTAIDTVTTPSDQLPSVAIVKQADVSQVDAADDPIDFSFVVTNNGNVTVTGIAVSDPMVGAVTCPVTALAPGGSTTCTADTSYLVTQDQLDAGQVDNTATVQATQPGGATITGTGQLVIPAPPAPSVALVKSSSTTQLTIEGQVVPFEFLVTNTGNVTLAAVSVDDPQTGPVTCPLVTLAPNTSTTCTADYTVTQDDVDAGRFENTATASATPPVGPAATATDSVVTPAPAGPAISVDKLDPTGQLEAGETIDYSFVVQNLGNVSLIDIAVDDPTANPVTCLETTLAPNATTTCSASYVVTQADVDAGQIVNDAQVSGTPPTGPAVVGTDQVTTTIDPEPSLALVKSSSTTEITTAGQVIAFSFLVTNTGNVTLTGLSVSDPITGPVGCPITQLAPGAHTTCSANYAATQADVDAGLFVNTAIATGTPPVGEPVTASDSVITPAPQGPALLVDKQAPTGTLAAGETITYAIRVLNAGNVTVSNVVVEDLTADSVICPATTLAPGGSTICNATYQISQADIDAGTLTNVATGTASSPGGPVSDTDTETTELPQNPQLSMIKRTQDTIDQVDQLLNYTFEVTNTGNVTFTGLVIDDELIDGVTCPVSTLGPDQSTTCTASYQVTQGDIDAGRVVNTATATMNDPAGEPTSTTATETTLGQQAPDITLEKQAPSGMLAVGQDITYFFRVINSGNVSLTNVGVVDAITTPVTCNFTTLLPGDSTQCSAQYTITQLDMDAGRIVNTAVATGTPPTGDDVTDTDSRTTPLPASAGVGVDKQAPTGTVAVDQTITYPFVVTNTGNVTLTNITIDDPIANPVTCLAATVVPGASTTCTASYVVTQADVDAGEIVNRATVAAEPPLGPPATGEGEETTPVEQNPAVEVTKNSPVEVMTVGATVTYLFDVINVGDVTLHGIRVDDTVVGLVTCAATELAPGLATACSGDYVVTQADVDAGNRNNRATVLATPPIGDPVGDVDEIDTAVPQTASLAINKQSSATALVAGQIIEFTFEVTNTGNVTIDGLTIDDPLANPVACPVTILAPGAATLCRANYRVTQANVNANQVTNTATATGNPPSGPPVTVTGSETVEGSPDPAINIDKTAAPGSFVLGSTIQYSFAVTNTGNQTLSNITVDDPLIGLVQCPGQTLSPGAVLSCTGSYTVTQADVDAGTLRNSATVSATDPGGADRVDSDVEVTAIEQAPSIVVDKQAPSGSVMVGEQISYPFLVTNTGTVTLTNVRVDDPLTAPVSCGSATLAPGGSTTCTGVYTVTQSDVNAGQIVNTATVTGDTRSGSTSGSDSETTAIVRLPQVDIAKVGPTDPAVLGQLLAYQLTVTNSGNVSLTDIVVDDPITEDEACPRAELEPGESMLCTASYQVTQADIEAGAIVNTATASAIDPGGEIISSQGESTTPAAQFPAITIDKESSGGLLLAGEPVVYSFVITNIGTVSLTNIDVADPLIPQVSCGATTLLVGETTTCAGTYFISQSDVDSGQVVNEATVSALPPSGVPTTATDRETTTFQADPALTLNKLAPVGDLVVDAPLTWSFEVTNEGNVTLLDLVVTDPTVGSVTCPLSILAPGATLTCTAISAVSQAQIDAGEIVNVATARVVDPTGLAIQSIATVTQPIEQNPELLVTKASASSLVGVGDEVPFTIDVENIGNVSLSDVQVSDPLAPVTCPVTALAPGETMTCVAVLTATQEMVDSGSINNTAMARGVPPSGIPIEVPGTAVVTVEGVAALTLELEGPSFPLRAGMVARYSLIVTNTGAVTLTNVNIEAPLTADVVCPQTTLNPGESMTCTASYRVTLVDEERGSVRNESTVSGQGPTGQQPSAVDMLETPTERSPTGLPSPDPAPGPAPVPGNPPPNAVPTPTIPVEVGPPLAQTGSDMPLSATLSLAMLAIGGMAVVGSRRIRRDTRVD